MTSETGLIKVGEIDWGNDTKYFDVKCNEISQIFLSGGVNEINAIQFQYKENGKYVLSEKYGSDCSMYHFQNIELNHPEEFITGIYGIFYNSDGEIMVITFVSNIRKYGPFGLTDPTLQTMYSRSKPFVYNIGKSCQFGGFHGAYTDSTLVSLGFYIRVKTVPPSFESKIPKKEASYVIV